METKYRPVLEVFPFTKNTPSTLHCKTRGKSHAVVGLEKKKKRKEKDCRTVPSSSIVLVIMILNGLPPLTPSATLTYLTISSSYNSAGYKAHCSNS